MSAYLMPMIQQYFDNNGDPLSGGKIYTCVAGATGTELAQRLSTYTDSGGLTANANPIILDSAGRCSMWASGVLAYKLFIYDSSDVLIKTIDNVWGIQTQDQAVTEIEAIYNNTVGIYNDTVTVYNNTESIVSNRIGSTGSASCRNKIRNPRFNVNQRSVSGTVTLAAGAFGHDGWKAGASGCTYTFTTPQGRTTLTITAGSLIQTIDGNDLAAGVNTHTLSWGGTCKGKVGAGSYSASGVNGSATGGTNIDIEFGTGTLYEPQFEIGTVASSFSAPVLAIDLAICCRYARVLASLPASTASATSVECFISLDPPMRSAPSASLTAPAKFEDPAVSTYTQSSAVVNVITGATASSIKLQYTGFSGMTAGKPGGIINTGGLTILSADI